jgi:DNA polymerase-3 subunit delta'
LELADPELWSFRNTLLQRLGEAVLPSVELTQTVATFVDEAGKEASARRARLRQVVAFAAEFYRQLLHAQCGVLVSEDVDLRNHVEQAQQRGLDDSELSVKRLDRCLDAAAQVDRNANQSTLIACWLDDLAAGRG